MSIGELDLRYIGIWRKPEMSSLKLSTLYKQTDRQLTTNINRDE